MGVLSETRKYSGQGEHNKAIYFLIKAPNCKSGTRGPKAKIPGIPVQIMNAGYTFIGKRSGNALAITYTAFNKPETITHGTNQIGSAHDPSMPASSNSRPPARRCISKPAG
jgi:hypothetical protein